MMKTSTLVLVLALWLAGAESAHEKGSPWDRNDYPDPQKDMYTCGRQGRKSYVCDPDHVIAFESANQLDIIIQEVMNHTRCPCASHYCGNPQLGFRIGVILVQKMVNPYTQTADSRQPTTTPGAGEQINQNMQNAKMFAYTQLVKWDLGECDEGVIIFYSVDDNVVYTMTGEEARKLLKEELIGEIAMNSRIHFTPGGDIFAGLRKLILDYKAVFQGTYIGMKWQTAAPQVGKSQSGNGVDSLHFLPILQTLLLIIVSTMLTLL